jgi:hypothetical protein
VPQPPSPVAGFGSVSPARPRDCRECFVERVCEGIKSSTHPYASTDIFCGTMDELDRRIKSLDYYVR